MNFKTENKEFCLFYSPQCKFSTTLLNDLKTHNLLDSFVLISIHNPKFNMPKFVDRVPLLYRVSDRTVIVDEAIDELVDKLKSTNMQKSLNSDLLAGFSELQTSGKIGDSFGFIEDDSRMLNSTYGYVNEFDADNQISLRGEDTAKQSKFNQQDYDKYLMDRDKELSTIFNSRSKPI